MADNTSIEWTDATWNPVTGCTKVSPGCDHCYAETFAERWRGTPGHHFERGFDVVLRPERLDQPMRWTKPRRIFVNSMSDLFHDLIPDEFIVEVFARMWWAPQHTFQVLTKRHGRMRSLVPRIEAHLRERERDLALVDCPTPLTWPLPNVWLGVSVEDQKRADLRVPALLDTPAAVRWLSCEPLLGPVELRMDWLRPVPGCRYASPDDGLCAHPDAFTPECHRFSDCPASPDAYAGVDWVVVGGESGRRARPMHPDWACSLRDQCESVSVSYFFKQHGEWVPIGPLYEQPGDQGEADDARMEAVALEVMERKQVVQLERNGCAIVDCPQPIDPRTWLMARVGKKAAGRALDGCTWDQYPMGVLDQPAPAGTVAVSTKEAR